MLSYILKRLLHFIPVLLGLTLLVFALLRLAPGDAARLRLVARGLDPSPETLSELRETLGLNRPLGEQYLRWLGDIGRLDFGRSVVTGKSVLTEYLLHLKASAALGCSALLFSMGIAFPAGVFSALFKGRAFDTLCRAAAITFLSIPAFCLGLFFILFFSVTLGWFPSFGVGSFQHLVLPVLTLGLGSAAQYTRFIRSVLLEEFSKDYIRAARARGIKPVVLVWGLALKNAAAPVLTTLGMHLAFLLGGSAVVEKVFSWPGAGKYLIDAILQRDYPVVQCVVICLACFFAGINLLTDILCMLMDPQLRHSSVKKAP